MNTDRIEWPEGRPRVLLTDCWLANAGDAAIALGLERMIRDLAPGAAVIHAAYQHDTIGPLIPGPVFVPPLEGLLGTPWVPPAAGWEGPGRRLVNGADLIISQGGGFLVEAYEPFGRIAALADAATIGPPTALVGQTIGRFTTSLGRRYLGTVMKAAALVVVRDGPSGDHAAELGATAVELGTDLALALFPDPPLPSERAGTGVVLTDHHPERARRPSQAVAAAALLEAVLARGGGEPVQLWSTVQGAPAEAREDDRAVAVTAVERSHPNGRAVALTDGYVAPLQAIDRVRSTRRLVTMRMHPALFAAASGTPFALVLTGPRRAVFDGTPLEQCLAEPDDRAGVDALLDRTWAMDDAAGMRLWNDLEPLRARLHRTQAAIAGLLATATAAGAPA
jgi:polysaccharide pyruvyl transferase WcaK-like protein